MPESPVWSLPDIDLSELPGSTGINDSIKDIALNYCRQVFVNDTGRMKLLLSTKAEPAYVPPSEQFSWPGPTLRIFVVVAYPVPPDLRSDEDGDVTAFKPLSWLQRNVDSCHGGEEVVNIIMSATTRAEEEDRREVLAYM